MAYSKSAKFLMHLILATALVLISALLSTVYAKDLAFTCDGIEFTVKDTQGASPFVASISTEKGTWIEIPSNSKDPNIYFLGIESGKYAKVSFPIIGGVKTMVLQTYKNFDSYKLKQSEMNLRCRK